MTVLHTGATKNYSANWEAAFGGKQAKAKPAAKSAKKKSPAKVRKKKR